MSGRDDNRWAARLGKAAGRITVDASPAAAAPWPWKTILHCVAIAFIITSSVLWTVHTLNFIHHASDRAKRACAGQTSLLGGEDAYYWCVQRVEAGGKP